MPDRIVRSGILTSDAVNLLSWGAEVFYRRLFSIVDDYGRFDGRPPLLRSQLYPLKVDRVSDADVVKWLAECATAGLVSVYQVSGRPYLEVQKFNQRIQGKPKYPEPEQGVIKSTVIHRDSPKTTAVDVDVDEDVDGKRLTPLVPSPVKPAPAEVVILLPLNDGTDYPITPDQFAKFRELYPAVDVMASLRKMVGWLMAKPKNRKTRRGVLAFVTSWLAKDQDSARPGESHGTRNGGAAGRAERGMREGDEREARREREKFGLGFDPSGGFA